MKIHNTEFHFFFVKASAGLEEQANLGLLFYFSFI